VLSSSKIAEQMITETAPATQPVLSPVPVN
jgi:hypothetical protein